MDAKSYVDAKRNPLIPDFRPGDAVRVHARVVEGERQRIQIFEGVVIRIRRGGVSSTFTVRRVTHGIGVERVFPYFSPLVEKVEVSRVGKVRRAKLYYLRERTGRAARIKPGSRARFEALTAKGAVAPEAEYVEEEEVLEEAEELESAEAETDEATEPEGEELVAEDEPGSDDSEAVVESVDESVEDPTVETSEEVVVEEPPPDEVSQDEPVPEDGAADLEAAGAPEDDVTKASA